MEVLPLLLVFFTVSGYSYKLQPRLSFMQKAELDTDQLSEMESASSAMERQDEGKSDLVPLESNPEEGGDLTPETKLPGKRKTGIHRNVEGPMERKEERENVSEKGLTGIERVVTEVVTGRGHNKNTMLTHTWIRDDAKHDTAIQVRGKDKQTVREEETGELVAGISLHKETGGDTHEIEKVPIREIIKERGKSNEGQRRAESEASRDEGPVLGSSPPPPTAAPQLLPSAAASVDPLTVAPQREHSVSAGDVILNPLINAARAEPQTTRTAQDPDADVQPEQSRSTAKAEPDPTPKPNDYTLSAKAAELKATTSTTQSKGPGNNVNKSQEKRGNEIKTQKPLEKKKKVAVETSFHYFTDNYCPLECACHGRVVQCSDKGVERVPYGIPYSARYVLLMNNHISSIQLDLLNDYVSMEFLVLSNNQLTDGAIEGAFYGVPALKRLYLDQNLLESVPTDLPACLEEIRLDHNRLRAVSPAAWTRSPGLRVLSLSNNSLGDGPEPLPDRVFAPLRRLRTLNLSHNRLASVPLGLPLSVRELYLRGNRIRRFRGGVFDGPSELAVLDVSGNRLRDKGLLQNCLVNATRLESINLEGNRLRRLPRHLPLSLKTLNLEGNLIASVKKAALGALRNLEHLGLARNRILKVSPGAFRALPALHQLDLSHNALHRVPRQLPPGLNSVALGHNRIRSVPRDAFCWGRRAPGPSGLVRVQLEHNHIDMGTLDARAFRCLRGFQVVHFY